MKIRNGFVSNSSSSSFIMKFQNKIEFDEFMNGTKWRAPVGFVPNLLSYVEGCYPDVVNEIDKRDNFTLKDAIEVFEKIIQTSKKGLTQEQLAEELSNGWFEPIDYVVDGYDKIMKAKAAAKLGMTVEEFEKDFSRLRPFWKRKENYRNKIAKYVAESFRHNEQEYFISFEISDGDGIIHGFLEHHFCKNVFEYDPSIICISHH